MEQHIKGTFIELDLVYNKRVILPIITKYIDPPNSF